MPATRPDEEAAARPFAPNADVYDAGYYARMYRPHWFLRNARKYRERDEALLRLVRPGPALRLLELGSARGDTALFLAPRVGAVVGVDAAPAAVAAARHRATSVGASNVRFEEADARDLSLLAAGSFDVALLADFVEHVEDGALDAVLAEAARLLVPGGALALYTPAREHWAERLKALIPAFQQPDHIAVRTSAAVVQAVERARFVVEELFFTPSPYPILGDLDRLLPGLGLCRFRTCLRARKVRSGP